MISLTQSAARYISKLSNKLRRRLDTLSSRKDFSGSQGRTLHFLLAPDRRRLPEGHRGGVQHPPLHRL